MKQTIAKLLASSYLLTLLTPLSAQATQVSAVSALAEPDFLVESTEEAPLETAVSSKQTRNANAESDFEYTISSNNVTITGHNITGGHLVIPETIEGYPVRHIAASAFNGAKITSVVVPDTVWTIGSYAFQSCDYLTTVTLGEDLQSIGVAAFSSCSILETVTMADRVVSIGSFAFANCTKLNYINLSKSLTTISSYMFENCTSLPPQLLPESVENIYNYAFKYGNGAVGSTTLSSVYVPEGATNISDYAFAISDSSSGTIYNRNPVKFTINGTSGSFIDRYCELSSLYTTKLSFTAVDYSNYIVAGIGIALSESTISAEYDHSYLITPTISPSNASNKAVTWTSSNEDVATVSQTGWVKGTGHGTANITATINSLNSQNPNNVKFTQTCIVTVARPTYTITFNGNAGTITGETTSTTDGEGNIVSFPTATRNNYVFAGWTDHILGGDPIDATTVFEEDTMLYAQWVDDDGTNTPATGVTLTKTAVDVEVGATETLVATVLPTNTHYKAVHWSSDTPSVATVDSNGKVTGITTGEAIITVTTLDGGFTYKCVVTVKPASAKTYTVTFNANGGTTPTTTGTTSTSGTLSSLPTPTRSGYTFKGWYTLASGGTEVTVSKVYTANTIIYAQWTEEASSDFTITFNPNGGTVSPTSSTTASTGTLSSLPTPTRSGYTFKGWYTLASGGTEVTVSKVYTANTIIYAQWTAEASSDFTITFDPNGGTVSPTSSTTTNGTLSTLPTPTRSGYTFKGWYTSASGNTAVSIYTSFSKSATIYAQWTLNSGDDENNDEEEDNDGNNGDSGDTTVAVTGVTISMSATGVVAGETKSLSATVAPTTATNKSVTWSSSNTSIATVNSSGLVTGVSAGTATITVTTADGGKTSSCVVTVTAAPSTTYTILFNSNGGSVTTFSGTTGSNGTLSSLPTPTRSGYTFKGWYTTATGSTQVTTSTTFSADGSIYAQWTKNDTSQDPPYTIKFSPMGGTVSDSTKDTNDIGKIATLPTVTRSGYDFQGWYTLSSGGTKITTSTVFTSDSTVYAQWKKEVTEEEKEEEDTQDEDTQDEDDTVTENKVVISGIGTSGTGGTVSFSATNPSTYTKVQLFITPFSGHQVETIRLVDGNNKEVKFYRDLASRSYYFYQPDTHVTADVTFRNTGVAPHTSYYSDVTSSDWHQQYVSYLTSFGIMNGSGGNFYPDTSADRGTIAQALLILSKESSTAFNDGTTSFIDISGSSYWNAVTWCSSRGVMSGYNDTIFGPTDHLTREQFATTLASFAKAMNLSNTNTTYQLDRFHDVTSISSWATSSVAWCVENDLMAGFDGYLKPKDTLTRSELATMLTTFYKKYVA